MKKEKKLALSCASIVLFVFGIIASYIGLLEVSHKLALNLNEAPTFAGVFVLMWQMLSHSWAFPIMLLCFIASAILKPACFGASVLASMFLFTGWLCAIHAGIVFLPFMERIYSSGWSWITISQHFTLTAGLIAVIIFGIGLVAHYYLYYRNYTWDDYTFKTLLP